MTIVLTTIVVGLLVPARVPSSVILGLAVVIGPGLAVLVGLAGQVCDEFGPATEALRSREEPVKVGVFDVDFDDAAAAG